VAAFNVRRKWQDNPPSIQRLKLEKALFTPAYGLKFFRRWMRSMLERNPIGWLERRSWSGRLVSCSWLAILIALFTWSLDNLGYGFGLRAVGTIVPWLLMLSIALGAAGSFRRERELGMMELLLVTPLRVGQIVSGRVRGLWGQFLPGVLLLIGIWLFLTGGKGLGEQWRDESIEGWRLIWLLSIGFLTLPLIGLYFSLRCRHYIVALFLTALIGVVLPSGLVALTHLTLEPNILFLVLLPMFLVSLPIAVTISLLGTPEYDDLRRRAICFIFFLAALFMVTERQLSPSLLAEAFRPERASALLLFPVFQVGLALICCRLLHRNLVNRTFAFPG
jgi:hypothetical protein